MIDMQVDIRGRVANIDLKPAECLLPLYETIINSIHAVEDAKISDGMITVTVKRAKSMFEETEAKEATVITGFEIVDNGVGFTEDNFRSFFTSDSRYKQLRGGKGVGRFLWLKAFGRAEVVSLYLETEAYKQRSFTFSLDGTTPVSGLEVVTSESLDRRTTVRLYDFKERYVKRAPHKLETIAQRIIEHCLKYFVLENAPSITVIDEQTQESVNLNSSYKSWVKQSSTKDFAVRDQTFTLTHFLLESHSGMNHRMSYCANHRVVKEEKLSQKVPNLTSTLEIPGESGKFVYAGYVAGDFLDKHVNQQRTDFSGILDERASGFIDELSWPEIEDATLQTTQGFLENYTDPIKHKKNEQIEEYVHSKAPQYRNLLKNCKDQLDQIPPGLSEEKLDLELYRLQGNVEMRLKEEAWNILKRQDRFSNDEVRGIYGRFLEQWNDLSKANLAKYIVQRRTTLHFLQDALAKGQDNKYALEDVVHKLIFPMKTTSDDVNFEDHNLWIVDEKLSYHYYLASDVALGKIKAVDTPGLERPDIIVFNRPIAVVDGEHPYSSVVILEFKRPVRDNYTPEDNPLGQIYRYIEKIRTSSVSTRTGRPFRVRDDTPFYCYIICDLTATLETQARGFGLQRTPDELGYFGYNPNYKAYVEIISFDKLLRDARQRNKILFDKLNITDSPGPVEDVDKSDDKRSLN